MLLIDNKKLFLENKIFRCFENNFFQQNISYHWIKTNFGSIERNKNVFFKHFIYIDCFLLSENKNHKFI